MHKKSQEPLKMDKYILWICLGIALLVLNYWYWSKYLYSNSRYITDYQVKEDSLASYRDPAVAGLFYAAQAKELSANVDKYLQAGQFEQYNSYLPKIIIVPHAGYVYSGSTAAKAYALLQKNARTIKNILLVGPSHTYGGKGVYLSSADYFSTPLGNVAVNKKMVYQLAEENKLFTINNRAHRKEHSIEVQLPFIQKVLPQAKIIPMLYGEVDPEILAEGLERALSQQGTLLVISADLSHYHKYEEARHIDETTASKIAKKQEIENHESCGATGINAALLLAQKENYYPQMLELVNSGDVSGDKNRVVGYGAWSFYPDAPAQKPLSELEKEVENLKNFKTFYQQATAYASMPYNEAVYVPEITSELIYQEESEILCALAEQESCIILGRTGFHIFRNEPNAFKIFLIADMPYRRDKVARRLNINEGSADLLIKQIDEDRENFTKTFSGKSRYDARNYDLTLNVTGMNADHAAKLIADYIASLRR